MNPEIKLIRARISLLAGSLIRMPSAGKFVGQKKMVLIIEITFDIFLT